jgi:multimeric flavodoxin WrbA
MKIACLFGSPRNNGNTAKVLGWVEDELVSKGCEIDRINITEYNVNGCNGCYACQEKYDEPGCIQQDDAVGIIERLMAADAIIYATPLYCWSFTSQLKPIIDRHLCIVTGYGSDNYNSLLEGKRTGLLVTCAGPEENNSEYIKGIYTSMMSFLGCKVAGILVIPNTTTPDELTQESKKKAEGFAGKMINA